MTDTAPVCDQSSVAPSASPAAIPDGTALDSRRPSRSERDMPAPDHERQPMSTKPPTTKQLAYLRALADRAGQTFATPRTSKDASAEIRRLKATPADSRLERKMERDEVADAIAEGPHDSARVASNEVTGYGISATWSRRS
jgi:hypothetical protein